jgi:hypothetical protein
MHDRGSGGQNGPGGGGTPGTGKPGSNGPGGSSQTPITSIFNSGKPSNAQSVPLPLLVLGGLAGLLLLSGAGTWLFRRTQARRVGRPPTPAVEKHR